MQTERELLAALVAAEDALKTVLQIAESVARVAAAYRETLEAIQTIACAAVGAPEHAWDACILICDRASLALVGVEIDKRRKAEDGRSNLDTDR